MNAIELPDANDALDEILALLTAGDPDGRRENDAASRQAAVFLDFDGTLAPIVDRPDRAAAPEATRRAVQRLAALDGSVCRVAIVSGRDLPDVRERAGVDGIAYAGSHGFDIQTADGEVLNPTDAEDYLEDLSEAEEQLRESVGDIEGAEVERKRYSLAVHYRRVPDAEAVDAIEARVEEALRAADGRLRLTRGKKVLDLQPALDWHKGRAIETLMDALGLEGPEVVPFYIGDDVTDEDAFRTLGEREQPGGGERESVTVVVHGEADAPRESAADYVLAGPDAVREFLDALADHLNRLAARRSGG